VELLSFKAYFVSIYESSSGLIKIMKGLVNNMRKYELHKKLIPLYDWDVIVIGGGPAGCAAAIASAREGVKTLLIEASGCLGGMGTLGLVPSWPKFSDGENVIYGGIAQKVVTKSNKNIDLVNDDMAPIDAELLKRVYDDMVTQSGAVVLLNSFVCDVDMETDSVVSTILVSNKAGLTAYRAKVYIDCTGDGDLAAWAGADYEKGDQETEELQPATHCFIITNVNEHEYKNGPAIYDGTRKDVMEAILKSGKYPMLSDRHSVNILIGPRTIGFNAQHIWDIDNTEPESVSKGLIEGRKIAASFHNALVEFHPKVFKDSFLVETAPALGIRETRRIIGDYILTLADYKKRQSFEDEIGRCCYPLDVHAREDVEKLMVNGKINHTAIDRRYKRGESYGIPYRCLTPTKLKNILVAGRPISCDRRVFGSIRVMAPCLVTGEAAGTAATQAIKLPEINVHNIDVSALRKRLKEYGVYFN
jgi:hypothetical protein